MNSKKTLVTNRHARGGLVAVRGGIWQRDLSLTEKYLAEFRAEMRELINVAISILSQLAHIERLLWELKREINGRDPLIKKANVMPTQFMFSARPSASSPALGRKKDRIEERAISAAFQRTSYDTVHCPNHMNGRNPTCMCKLYESPVDGQFRAPVPRIVF